MFSFLRRPRTQPSSLREDKVAPALPPGALEIEDPQRLLERHNKLVSRIIQALGLKKADEWQVITACEAAAAFYQNLPLTRNATHREPGGAFRFSLETAFTAAQITEGVIFSGLETVECRRVHEPVWRYATFLSSLASDVHLCLSDRLIVGVSSAQTWSPLRASLWSWAEEHEEPGVIVQWRSMPASGLKPMSAYVLPHILPVACMEMVASMDVRILENMMSSITGQVTQENVLHQVVQSSREAVIQRDVRASLDRPAHARAGTLDQGLIEIMRHLIESEYWKINKGDGTVFLTDSGVFVEWDRFVSQVPSEAERMGIIGLPRSEGGFAEFLHVSGLASLGSDGSIFFFIELLGRKRRLIKLSDEAILFPVRPDIPLIQQAQPGSTPSPTPVNSNSQQVKPATDPTVNQTATIAPVESKNESRHEQPQIDVEKLGLVARMVMEHIGKDMKQPEVSQYLMRQLDGSGWLAADAIVHFGFDAAPIFNELSAVGLLMPIDGKKGIKDKREMAGKKREAVLLKPEMIGWLTQIAETQQ